MEKIVIEGGNRLSGSINVQGSKNSVLPILAATVLSGSTSVLHNCPDLSDVHTSLQILKYLGCDVTREGDTVTINSEHIVNCFIPENLMREMRSSVIFLGAIAARCRRAMISAPGGCELGLRSIDLHLKAFRKMGMRINESHGYIDCEVPKLTGEDIHLDFPSVGATENIMLAATCAKGTTRISNAAREPEIVDLQNYLNKIGAKITGAGTDTIFIENSGSFHSCEHTIIPDRIVAVTYLCAAAATRGEVELQGVIPEHFESVINALRECKCKIFTGSNFVRLETGSEIYPVEHIRTLPYPAFPTDAQAPMMALLTTAKGTSIITETIFESRFKHVDDLVRMGANIKVDGRVSVIKGVRQLTGANVNATDLRGGAALVIAALMASGVTTIGNIHHIDRGYENLEENLRSLGANIKRVKV